LRNHHSLSRSLSSFAVGTVAPVVDRRLEVDILVARNPGEYYSRDFPQENVYELQPSSITSAQLPDDNR
jgi:hypothetical protein